MKIIDEPLLAAMRLRPCDNCGKPGPSQASHTLGKGFGGWSRMDIPINLTSLCLGCHERHHAGHRPRKGDLIVAAAVRLGLDPDFVHSELYRLQRLSNDAVEDPKACCRSRSSDPCDHGVYGEDIDIHGIGYSPRGENPGMAAEEVREGWECF